MFTLMRCAHACDVSTDLESEARFTHTGASRMRAVRVKRLRLCPRTGLAVQHSVEGVETRPHAGSPSPEVPHRKSLVFAQSGSRGAVVRTRTTPSRGLKLQGRCCICLSPESRTAEKVRFTHTHTHLHTHTTHTDTHTHTHTHGRPVSLRCQSTQVPFVGRTQQECEHCSAFTAQTNATPAAHERQRGREVSLYRHTHAHTHTHTDLHRDTEAQREGRQTDKQTDRQTERQAHTHTQRRRDWQTDTQTHTQSGQPCLRCNTTLLCPDCVSVGPVHTGGRNCDSALTTTVNLVPVARATLGGRH